jgi:hypothetical protein
MKVVFYSEQCDYCKKLLAYMEKYNISSLFKLINIDKIAAPKDIDIVPTIIDTELNQPLKGKKAFEYLFNIKYFNNPTNNIEYIKEIPVNPNIPEDEKAIKSKSLNLEFNQQSQSHDDFNDVFTQQSKIETKIETNESTNFNENNSNSTISKATQEMVNARNVQDKKLAVLLQMRRR